MRILLSYVYKVKTEAFVYMDREALLTEYRTRIERGDRIKLTAEDRAFLVEAFVEDLQELTSAEEIRERCAEEIALLEVGYGAGTNSTTNYLSKYRKAVEEAVATGRLALTDATSHQFHGRKQATGEAIDAINHLAWSLMRYDNEVYARNRRATNVANNQRQDEPQPFVPERYLEKAKELLGASDAETLAVGIAAVTGRRHTEVVVSGSFSLTSHPHLLQFNGQLKKAHPIAYPIVTLLPAKQVLEAIDRFRTMPQVQALAGLSSDDRALKAFRARVNSRVKSHFEKPQILPTLPGFQSVSVHRLRAAYARMAVYFWLPNQGTNEHRFLQFYLGHVSAAEMRDAPNAPATTHYFGYRLVDEQEKPITARGVKLMANPPLPMPTQEQMECQLRMNQQLEGIAAIDDEPDASMMQEDEGMMTKKPLDQIAHQIDSLPEKPAAQAKAPRAKTKALEVPLPALSRAAENLGLVLESGKGKGYQALLYQVLEAVAQGQSVSALSHDVEQLKTLLQDATAEAQTRALLAREVEALNQQLQQAIGQRDALQAQLDDLASLQQEYGRVKDELALKTERLNQFLQLASGAAAGDRSPVSSGDSLLPPPPQRSPAQTVSSVETLNHQEHPIVSPQPQVTSLKRSPEDRIQLAVQALFHHNEQCTEPSDRWFISGNIIADMSRTNPATRVKPWLDNHPDVAEAIDLHNHEMETTAPHHNRRKDKQELRSIYETFEKTVKG